MSFDALLNQTCTIRRVTTVNDGPEPSEVWATTASDVPCRLSMLRAIELGQLHQTMAITHRLYLPYSTDVTNDDRVIVDSVTYEVEMVNANPGSRQHHVEALIKVAT